MGVASGPWKLETGNWKLETASLRLDMNAFVSPPAHQNLFACDVENDVVYMYAY